MRSLLSIIVKDLKVLSRSKLSTFLVLLAPILIVFLVGTAFNSDSLHNLKLGTYSASYNDLSDSIINDLGSKQFIAEKISSESLCIQQVKEGALHACVVFPADLSIDGNNESVVIYADNSRINLAYAVINEVNSRIESRSSEIGVVAAQSLLTVVQHARDSLPAQKEKVDSAVSGLEDIHSKSASVSGELGSVSDALASINAAIVIANGMNSSSQVSSLKSHLSEIQSQLQGLNETSGDLRDITSSSSDAQSDLQAVSTQLNAIVEQASAISVTNAEDVIVPIRTEIRPLTGDSSSWKYLFPTLVALITLLSSMVLSSSMVFAERKARSHFRNFMTPTSDVSFVLGTYLTCILIMGVQLAALFVGTSYLTSIDVSGVAGQIAVVLFLAASTFIFLGMVIGYLFKSDETTVLAAISISSLLIFFSNALLPTEVINSGLRYLAAYNPFFLTDVLLRKAILFGSSFAALTTQIMILAASLAILFVLTLVSRKMTKRVL